MQEEFVVLELQELAEGELPSVTAKFGGKGLHNRLQLVPNGGISSTGALCSIVLGKLNTENGRTSPPMRLSVLDSIGLRKGNTITINTDGPVVTDLRRSANTHTLASPLEMPSDWEVQLLSKYFPEEIIKHMLRPTQQHEVYTWLCNEPLYLVFYPLFGLPRLSYAQYTDSLSDFQPSLTPYTEDQVAQALELVERANNRWRHGYTPHIGDISLSNTNLRNVVVEIFRRLSISFDSDGWLSWPYPKQIEQRITDKLLSIRWLTEGNPFQALDTVEGDETLSDITRWMGTGGLKLLELQGEHASANAARQHIGSFIATAQSLPGVAVIECCSAQSLQSIFATIEYTYDIVLLDVHMMPLFALFQLMLKLSSLMRRTLCLHFNTAFQNSTTCFLLQAGYFDRKALSMLPSLDLESRIYHPELRLDNPCLYRPGLLDSSAIVPGLDINTHAISFTEPCEMPTIVNFYSSYRHGNMSSWEVAFVVATDRDRRQHEPNLWQSVHGTRDYVQGVRCSPASNYRVSPAVRTEQENVILYFDGTGRTEHCAELQSMECLTLDEMTFRVAHLLFYSSVPITRVMLQKLLHIATTSILIISNESNLVFLDS